MTATTLHLATTPADHARLAELAHTIWHEHYPAIIGIAQVNYMLARGYSAGALAAEQRAGTRFVLAYQNDTAIGLAATTPAGDEAWLDKLYVHTDARGTGVARALYEDTIAFARRACAQRLRAGASTATTPARLAPINGLGSSSKPKTSRISAGAMSWMTI